MFEGNNIRVTSQMGHQKPGQTASWVRTVVISKKGVRIEMNAITKTVTMSLDGVSVVYAPHFVCRAVAMRQHQQ